MIRLWGYLMWVALAIGIGEVGVQMVIEMAGKAAHAYQYEQISYSKWNKRLWEAKPVSPPHTAKKKHQLLLNSYELPR